MKRVLIIEDDPVMVALERHHLERNMFKVDVATMGVEGVNKALNGDYSLIIRDVMLPDASGFDVCRTLRETLDIPIVMVTSKNESEDTITGLHTGADDYITKPFDTEVFVARVEANIAQYERIKQAASKPTKEINSGSIRVLTESRRVFVDDREVVVKNKEYELLLFLIENQDFVFSREMLYQRVWGMDSFGDTATVSVHINRLREKIGDDPARPQHIQTVRGAGYRFNAK